MKETTSALERFKKGTGEKMINANKGMVKLEGTAVLLEAEVVTVVKALYDTLADQHGEDFAKERIERVFKAATETEQEHEFPIPESLNGLLQGILEDVLSALKKKEGKGEE